MVVVETNLLSGVIFCGGGFFLTIPTNKPTFADFPVLGNFRIVNA